MSSIIAENTIVASSYKNNSLPLEEGGDRKLVLLTHDSHGYHIRILEFTDQDEWEVVLSLRLSSENCVAYPPISTGYIFSLAFFDDLDGPTERFYVFLGYGCEPGQNRIWYFVFDLDNSTYRFLNCDEFDDILHEDQYFRQLTLAPKDEDGICRLVVGYKQDVARVWKSGFHVGYLSLNAGENTLSFSRDYTKVPLEIGTTPPWPPKPIRCMGIIARDDGHDLVLLIPGPVGPNDDVLFVHTLGNVNNPVRESWGLECGGLLDHPWYFAKMQLTRPIATETNIAIVREDVEGVTGSSLVRYATEPTSNVFNNWKVLLDESPDIPAQCRLFHMDSGDMTGDVNGDDDLVVIWKECPDDCELDYYVLKITDVSPGDPEDCLDISFEYSFADGFAKGDDIDDLVEPMYIRYTAKDGGYFLSLFYHDSHDGISVHVHEYDFPR